jgi:hypothetical protein
VDGALYGVTSYGELIALDPNTGKGELLAKYDGRVFAGATAWRMP